MTESIVVGRLNVDEGQRCSIFGNCGATRRRQKPAVCNYHIIIVYLVVRSWAYIFLAVNAFSLTTVSVLIFL